MAEAKKNTMLPGGVKPAQLAAWKKEHKVHVITVEKGDEKIVGYVKEPGRNEYGTAAQIMQKENPLSVGQYLLNNCKLGGDERIWTEDKVYMSAAIAATELIEVFPATISEG